MLKINSSNVIERTVTKTVEDPEDPNKLITVPSNDATVTITITDSAGDQLDISPLTWPQTLPYVTDSDGLYRETFAPFDNLIEDEIYTILTEITTPSGLVDEDCLTCKATRCC